MELQKEQILIDYPVSPLFFVHLCSPLILVHHCLPPSLVSPIFIRTARSSSGELTVVSWQLCVFRLSRISPRLLFSREGRGKGEGGWLYCSQPPSSQPRAFHSVLILEMKKHLDRFYSLNNSKRKRNIVLQKIESKNGFLILRFPALSKSILHGGEKTFLRALTLFLEECFQPFVIENFLEDRNCIF